MTTGLRQTVIEIINRVQRALGVSSTANPNDNSLSTVILDTLNEVMADLSDSGDWQEMFREVNVTAVASATEYEIAVSGLVKSVYEISFGSQVSPLEVRDIQDIRRLQRVGSYGEPRQFAIVGVSTSSGNPLFRPYPVPTNVSGKVFDVAFYQKPELYAATTAAGSLTVPFPANLVYQGVYAMMLLKENGGEATKEYQSEYAKYLRMRKEALNRFNSDTGTDIYMVPG